MSVESKKPFIILLDLTLPKSRLEASVAGGEGKWGICCNDVFLCCVTHTILREVFSGQKT